MLLFRGLNATQPMPCDEIDLLPVFLASEMFNRREVAICFPPFPPYLQFISSYSLMFRGSKMKPVLTSEAVARKSSQIRILCQILTEHVDIPPS